MPRGAEGHQPVLSGPEGLTTAAVRRALEPALTERLGGPLALSAVEQRSEGWSQYTFILVGRHRGEGFEWVARIDPGRNMWNDEQSLERQLRILTGLAGQGVPAPLPIAFLKPMASLGSSVLVMERLPGEAIVPWSRRGREVLAEARAVGLVGEFTSILAAIHRSRWSSEDARALGGPGTFAQREIARWRQLLASALWRPDPIAELALVWLTDHLPEQGRNSLVHGDYRTGNLLFHEGRITGVLDWESADWGDPEADLGYACSPPHLVDGLCCGVGGESELVSSYEEHASELVDIERLRFFKVLATLKNHAIWVQAGAQALRGETSDLRTARGVLAAQNVRAMLLGLLLGSEEPRFVTPEHPIIESEPILVRLRQLAGDRLAAGVSEDSFGTGQRRASQALETAVAAANPPDLVAAYRAALVQATGSGLDATGDLEEVMVQRIRQRAGHAGVSSGRWFEEVLQALGTQFAAD